MSSSSRERKRRQRMRYAIRRDGFCRKRSADVRPRIHHELSIWAHTGSTEYSCTKRTGGRPSTGTLNRCGTPCCTTAVVIDWPSGDHAGAPAWSPDGQSITTAVVQHGVPHLFRVPVDGRPPVLLVQEYSVDPVWAQMDSSWCIRGLTSALRFLQKPSRRMAYRIRCRRLRSREELDI